MILTVTPNVALDITYRVDQLTPGSSHRVRGVKERAGGKGINVASVLHALGHDTTALADPQLKEWLRRGVEWAATGKVTLPDGNAAAAAPFPMPPAPHFPPPRSAAPVPSGNRSVLRPHRWRATDSSDRHRTLSAAPRNP